MMKFEKEYAKIIAECDQISEGKLGNIAAGALAAGSMLFGPAGELDAKTPEKTKIEQSIVSPKVDFVSKVLYCETSSVATPEEINLIASVIYNRMYNKAAFGRLATAYDVVKVPGQFSCVNDSHNSNWKEYKWNLNKYTKNTFEIAKKLMNGTFTPVDTSITLYHDKSLSEPPAKMYSRKYWTAELVKTTEHFKFYKLIPKKSK